MLCRSRQGPFGRRSASREGTRSLAAPPSMLGARKKVEALHGPWVWLALAAAASAQGAGNVQAPSPWYAGDTHEMIQLCQTGGGGWPPDRDPADVYQEMIQKDLRVSNVLVLITGQTGCAGFLSQYAPRVNGQEHALTASDPDFAMQFGCEAVGTNDLACPYPKWGHVAGLGIRDAFYDLDADYPAPILDFFRAQPGAVAGYPHVAWPESTSIPGGFPPLDPGLTRLHPLLAPMDVALGRVDFLGTADVGAVATQITPHPWWGLWYKLLSAGQRVSIAGGTVAQCYVGISGLDARTWVRLESEPFTYEKWLRAFAAGRVSIADGPSDFLELRVGSAQTGEELQLPGAGLVVAEATLFTGVPRTAEIEIVQDGKVVASRAVQLTGPGSHTFRAALTVNESSWIAARTRKAHTGAVFAIVAGRPIADPDAAEYFRAFGVYLTSYLDLAKAICAACVQPTCKPCLELMELVGTSEAQIRGEIAEAQRTYLAIRDYERPIPGDAERYGTSSSACLGPIGIGLVDDKPAGGGAGQVRLTCFNAPPNTGGVLLIGSGAQQPAISQRGASILVALDPMPSIRLLRTNGGGYAEVVVPIPALTQTLDVYAQFVWNNPSACPGGGPWSSSDALRVGLPRRIYPGR